ncbi:MAG: PrsW family glutamic-type intramembrane protease [Candidatus Nealsonbacteria bacterium]|nr:PrsW family glutamic-type intramembrane protease [Candidatus Nealsonbacteria bacterium]
MSYLLYILFGFFPSIAWLLFYLKADVHPEPKKEILAVFLFGALATIPAIILEVVLVDLFNKLPLSPLATAILVNVIGVALIEELAIENLLFLLPIIQMNLAIMTSLFRALSAILLHTLCSGTIGYYLALSFCDPKRKKRLILKGILIASSLHGLYNLFIIKSESNVAYLYIPLLILTGLAVFLYRDFKKLKKMGSVCKIKEILA